MAPKKNLTAMQEVMKKLAEDAGEAGGEGEKKKKKKRKAAEEEEDEVRWRVGVWCVARVCVWCVARVC